MISAVPPTRMNRWFWSTRKSLTCILRGISPTSSMKRVPLLAISKYPIFWLVAPVKEPFSCPKNSLSEKLFRVLAGWTAKAGPFAG